MSEEIKRLKTEEETLESEREALEEKLNTIRRKKRSLERDEEERIAKQKKEEEEKYFREYAERCRKLQEGLAEKLQLEADKDIPKGYERVRAPVLTRHVMHNCNCNVCDHNGEKDTELTADDLGIIFQIGEAFGDRIKWFGRTSFDEEREYRFECDTYEDGECDTYEIGNKPVTNLLGEFDHHIGDGLWTRYDFDEPVEHVIRTLKKKGTTSKIED